MEVTLAGPRTLRVGCPSNDFCRAQTSAILDRITAKRERTSFEVIEVQADPTDAGTLAEATGAGACDFFVCSARDLPIELPDDVAIAACTERRDPFDVLVAKDGTLLEDLPERAALGVDSARVAVQIASFRSDLAIERIKGTVDRLLDRLNGGEFAAFIVAAEQVEILGWEHAVSEVFPPDIILPAAGQGSFAVVARRSDEQTWEVAQAIDHKVSHQVLRAERAFLRELGVRSTDPVAVHGAFEGETLVLEALLGDEVSGAILRDDLDGRAEEEDDLGVRLAKLFVADGARDYLASYR